MLEALHNIHLHPPRHRDRGWRAERREDAVLTTPRNTNQGRIRHVAERVIAGVINTLRRVLAIERLPVLGEEDRIADALAGAHEDREVSVDI